MDYRVFRETHAVHSFPLLYLDLRASNSSEPREEPLSYSLCRVLNRILII